MAERPYEVCNCTLQRKILNVPDEFLKTEGFILLTKCFPGMRFVKKKNDQVNVMFDAHGLSEPYVQEPWPSESLHRIILSNCNDGTIIMKVLGVKSKPKVNPLLKLNHLLKIKEKAPQTVNCKRIRDRKVLSE